MIFTQNSLFYVLILICSLVAWLFFCIFYSYKIFIINVRSLGNGTMNETQLRPNSINLVYCENNSTNTSIFENYGKKVVHCQRGKANSSK